MSTPEISKDTHMKAIQYTKYGPPDVLQLKEVEKPVPKGDEVLIRVYATTVTAGEYRIRSFTIPLHMWLMSRIYLDLEKPKSPILGSEIAGKLKQQAKI